MSSYVWMRLLESAPDRYDLGIRLLSLGRIDRVYAQAAQLARGPDVLDLGCGTGNLTSRLARPGVRVTGVDLSSEMLAVARRKISQDSGVRWVQTSAVELIDHFAAESFDTIVSILMFSELSDAEQRLALEECMSLLRPGGQLIVADEVQPSSLLRRALHGIVRAPLAAITYALTQASTRPVIDLWVKVIKAGFSVKLEESSRLGDFTLLEAGKREA